MTKLIKFIPSDFEYHEKLYRGTADQLGYWFERQEWQILMLE